MRSSGSRCRCTDLRHLAQHLGAEQVSVRVDDLLEAVHVEEHERQLVFARALPGRSQPSRYWCRKRVLWKPDTSSVRLAVSSRLLASSSSSRYRSCSATWRRSSSCAMTCRDSARSALRLLVGQRRAARGRSRTACPGRLPRA